MSRPDVVLTPAEAARLKGEEWKVPEPPASMEVVVTDRKDSDGNKVERTVYRWSEVGIVTQAKIDQNGDGTVKGRLVVLLSDEDHHRNTNPRHRLTVWINIHPHLLTLKSPPPVGDPDRGAYYGSSSGMRILESFLKAVGETGVLVNRKTLLDLGAAYDLFEQTDLSGREVLVSLQYPARYEKSADPDVRYFEVIS